MDDEITNYWDDLEKEPKLVLSVIGDSKSFVPRAWPKSVFKRALIEAGKSSGGGAFVCLLVFNILLIRNANQLLISKD